MPRLVNALLAVWMAVAATGTVVSHRHAAPAGHAHGYGWVSLAPTGDAVPESRPHHHFVLAGIEFGAIPGTPDQGNDSQVVSAGVLTDTGVDTAPPAPALAPVGWCSPPAPRLVAAPVSPAPSRLCDIARHARTGVLLS